MIFTQGHPIEFDYCKNGFYYAGPYVPLVAEHVTEDEIEALHMLESALELLKQMPHAAAARSALEKVINTLSKSVDYPKERKSLISFHTADECIFPAERHAHRVTPSCNSFEDQPTNASDEKATQEMSG